MVGDVKQVLGSAGFVVTAIKKILKWELFALCESSGRFVSSTQGSAHVLGTELD